MKFTINFSANLTAFLLSVFLSVWMTPFIVKTLGVEAFGFVNLTQNVINYFSIITVALSSVVVRFFLLQPTGESRKKQMRISAIIWLRLF